jgi:polysaccharide export outer membrane protein
MPRKTAIVSLLALILAGARLGAQVYEVGAGDMLKITVTGQTGLSGEFPVDSAGMLLYPLLGKVKASGLTTQALEKKLVTLLSDGYLKRPEVNIAIKEANSQRVFVTGEVGKPGPYSLKGDRTLMTLMTDLGGLQQDAGHEAVIVRPPDADSAEAVAPTLAPTGLYPNEVPGSQIIKVSLRELLSGNPAKNIELLPNDTIYFPKAANIYVTGYVFRPGPIRYQEGLTVFQALTLAGGVTDKGSQKIKIIRVVDGKPTEVKGAKLTDVLQPEDTVKVPERFF